MIQMKSGSGNTPGLGQGLTSVKSKGPSGTGRGRPEDWWYEHTQKGLLIIGAVSVVTVIICVSMYLFGIVWVTAIVLAIMLFLLAIMSTLTVSICDADLRIHFGPIRVIRKSWPLGEIVSATAVTNPWYYGWGIRITPHGILYNISGYGAVELLLENGKTFRIGTDEPDALCHAITTAKAAMNSPK